MEIDMKTPRELGPKQIMWLRENVPHFHEMEKRAAAARHAGITPRKGVSSEDQPTTTGDDTT